MPNFFQLIFGKYTNNVAENEIKDTNKAQDIHSKYKKLQVIEEQLKLKRDFEGLLNIHHEFLNLINATGEHVDRLPQIAYCLARLGRKDESMESLKKLAEFSYMIDRDEIYRATVLVTCFTDNQKADLNLMQYNTIKSWLQHPDYSKQVVEKYLIIAIS